MHQLSGNYSKSGDYEWVASSPVGGYHHQQQGSHLVANLFISAMNTNHSFFNIGFLVCIFQSFKVNTADLK